MPKSAVQAPDGEFVARWDEMENGTFGKANAKGEAWFPLGGKEYYPDSFFILVYSGDISVIGYDYYWAKVEDVRANPDLHKLLQVGGYSSCLTTLNGSEVLGKYKLSSNWAWSSYAGKETAFKNPVDFLVLCYRPVQKLPM